jgi:ornithine cyclodeaminase
MNVYSLSKADIEQVIHIREIIDAVKQGFIDYSDGKAVIPPVVNLNVQEHNGEVHIKSCHIQGFDRYCIKIASGFWNNPKLGLPSGYGMMLLFEAQTGILSAVLFDEGLLTDLRTAAAGALSALYLAKKNPAGIGIIGCGVQGHLQAQFLAEICPFSKLYTFDSNPEAMQNYQKDLSKILPAVTVVPCLSPGEVAACSDILITATPSRTPFILKNDLHPGLHITAVGADGPDKQEIDECTFPEYDKIVVDHIEQCSRLGELHHALKSNIISADAIYGELGNIISNKLPGRVNDNEITLCDLTGVAIQDIAIANWAVNKAQERQLGRWMRV